MSLRIVFMGTPQFAVPSLDILVKNGYEVVGVITATDKAGGRGKNKLIQSAVRQYAEKAGLRILQPPNLKNSEFLHELQSLKADLQVVVAFRMLPEVVWSMPTHGTLNLHGSLLPQYRGAAPINWAIIKGETETGVTTFFLKHEIDTGDILLQEPMPIGPNETAGELHDRMMQKGSELVLKSVKLVEQGSFQLHSQPAIAPSFAPKLTSENCQLNFSQTAQQVHNFVRGLSPFPGAWTTLGEQKWKILRSEITGQSTVEPPGTVRTDHKREILVACEDNWLKVVELQVQGKKRMRTQDFLNGNDLSNALRFGN